ncbi:SPFH domain-containing protein [uncultured Gilliamella sp.]|jgi:Putative virion core protein (lumpy skin disease virus)|uniref:SPFH domain-containing protein n=1 Tax=uncultured Gilliamella sp. TaxID=1193505 RepID=UPI0025D8ED95|nr:SPFH domain-containing protein [uncultured Gilliamella sp.]
MALSNFFKRQLKTVIEWTNQDPNVLFYEFQPPTNEIKNASKLIVNPGQGCILVYKGEVIDVLTKSGIYELSTSNHPFITNLIKILQSFESEHKMHVYFFRMASLVNQKWGTSTPIKYVDAVYQFPVELGAYGTYSIKIEQAELFFSQIIGAKSIYTANDLSNLIISRVIPTITSQLATESYSYQNIDSQLVQLSEQIKSNLKITFSKLGLVLDDFQVEATSFSQDTLDRISKIADSRTDALAAKEVGLNYVEHEKLKALRDAAQNEGGLAGAGLQLGAGMELAKSFDLNNSANNANTTTATNNNETIIKQLKQLKELVDEGILTQDEFNAKKAQLLEKL